MHQYDCIIYCVDIRVWLDWEGKGRVGKLVPINPANDVSYMVKLTSSSHDNEAS